MHILLVNDDGYDAPGLLALYRAARAAGHRVTLCAPKTQQSAMSHGIQLSAPIFADALPALGEDAYAVSSTPADCVRVALGALVKAPVDLCISGINNGWNAGVAVYYSGTVSAAREAALSGLPAMAVSIDFDATPEMLDHLAAYAVALSEKIARHPLPRQAVVSLNAPALPPDKLKPLRFAPLCQGGFSEVYERRESPRGRTYFWLRGGAHPTAPTPGGDVALLMEGHLTCTVLGPYCDFNAQYAPFLQD